METPAAGAELVPPFDPSVRSYKVSLAWHGRGDGFGDGLSGRSWRAQGGWLGTVVSLSAWSQRYTVLYGMK